MKLLMLQLQSKSTTIYKIFTFKYQQDVQNKDIINSWILKNRVYTLTHLLSSPSVHIAKKKDSCRNENLRGHYISLCQLTWTHEKPNMLQHLNLQ